MDTNNISHELKCELLSNNFDKAKKIALELSYNLLWETLTLLAFETESVLIYTFVVSLLLEKETAEYHSLASDLLAQSLYFLEGGYAASLFHARKSLDLDPNNIDYKQYLLFFYGLPDKVMSNEEAYKIAQEVIKIKPASQVALRVIDKLRNQELTRAES